MAAAVVQVEGRHGDCSQTWPCFLGSMPQMQVQHVHVAWRSVQVCVPIWTGREGEQRGLVAHLLLLEVCSCMVLPHLITAASFATRMQHEHPTGSTSTLARSSGKRVPRATACTLTYTVQCNPKP
jgi:hypothetical protein